MLDGDKREEPGYEPQSLGALNESTRSRDTAFLPGDSGPEEYIFSRVADNLDVIPNLAAKLTLALTLDIATQERVRDSVHGRRRTNRDRHIIFSQIGEDLDFLSELIVRRAFVVLGRMPFLMK
nr:hypothetical protein GCM10020241_24540 [Streptoalloteichus tenebrarius]